MNQPETSETGQPIKFRSPFTITGQDGKSFAGGRWHPATMNQWFAEKLATRAIEVIFVDSNLNAAPGVISGAGMPPGHAADFGKPETIQASQFPG